MLMWLVKLWFVIYILLLFGMSPYQSVTINFYCHICYEIKLLNSGITFLHKYCGQLSMNTSVRNYTHIDGPYSKAINVSSLYPKFC